MSADTLEIRPLAAPPDTAIAVPGSKSISNRALLLAALADGESVLEGALFSDDTRYMGEALRQLGASVEADTAAARLRVVGCGGRWPARNAELFVGNAGTAMRFLAAAACLGEGSYRLDGTPRMRERPIGDLVRSLGQLGAQVRCELDNDCPPVRIDATGLEGGTAEIDASRSSQFLSALLHVAPCARHDVELRVRGGLISRPYVAMTLGLIRAFGVEVESDDAATRFRARSGQAYRARSYRIEPDASSAHYFLAAAALTGGRVRVEGLSRASLQGDVRFADVLERMGATVVWEEDAIEVRGPAHLRGVDVDMNDISDTAPTLAVLGAFADRPVRLHNVEHLRWQESDRLHAVATELRRLGVAVDEQRDGLTVTPAAPRAAVVETYDDHRIAMSFALVGLLVPGIRIRDPQCVAKTFPDYFERLELLRR